MIFVCIIFNKFINIIVLLFTIKKIIFLAQIETAISGSVGGMALWTIIFPADVIKSRMQVTNSGRFLDMFFNILKKEGN